MSGMKGKGPIRGLRRQVIGAGIAALALGVTLPVLAQDVQIGMSSRNFQAGIANMWIGIPLGLYGPLNAETVGTQGATENLQLMLAGRLTMSTGTQDVVLNAMAEGRQMPAVAPCVYLDGLIQRLTVLPDSTAQSYNDLTGKKVGVPALASGDVQVLNFLLTHAGIDPQTVDVIAVGDKQQAAAALQSGAVDALVLTDTGLSDLQAAGVKMRELPVPDAVKDVAVGYTFAFERGWYDGHKDAAAQMLQGMIKAIIVATENPEAAARISFHMHPEALPASVSLDQAVKDAVRSLSVRAPLITRDRSKGEKWCDFSPDQWATYVDMLGLKGKVDPMKFYTNELVDKINDFDEDALRAWARSLVVPDDAAEYDKWIAGLKAPA
ncbi:MAG TPA: ABC transporter substrate-binding protein [Devosiaceae bacterium]|jgi:NitT/TauT family transport system substrate-binding protein